ncbi:molybdopterin-dependent oxidoreductase [Jannaschia sp. R86511]|uniref:molybdopterin-dependent oxidoreductase n=1 Tax=Jannaschia sp. R86511 TaxID=3093853 RepID=UPI0036D2D93B
MHVRLVATAAALVLLAGCGAAEAAAPAGPADDGPSLTVADVPAGPAEDVVLTLLGGADNGAAGEGVALSLEQVEQLGTRELEVYEPFLEQDVSFTVVPLADVLALAELDPDVTTLHTIAYNEYAVDITRETAETPGAWLATRADGEPIAVADGGPTRVVFTDEHPEAGDEALWIWSIATVEPA